MRSTHVHFIHSRDRDILQRVAPLVEPFELDSPQSDLVGKAYDDALRRFGQDAIAIGSKLEVPQPSTMGGQWLGLDATPTGSNASEDVVADFTGSTATLFDTPSVAVPVLATHSQTVGSTFKIQTEGLWFGMGRVMAATAASIRAGIGIDNVAGDLSIDPVLTSRTLDAAISTSTTADVVPVLVQTGPVVVTRAIALAAASGIARLLLSNNAGAGATAASLAPLAMGFVKLLRLGNIPRAMA